MKKARSLALATVPLLVVQVVLAQNSRIGESCDLAYYGIENKESIFADRQNFLVFDRELRAALSNLDPLMMSLLVRFPLRINGGAGGTISLDSPRALQARFAEAFPPAVREAVLEQPPETVFCNASGLMYAHGRVWIDVSEHRFAVMVINLPKARDEDRPRAGEEPDVVCDAENHRVLIYSDESGTSHARIWKKPNSIIEKPDLELSPVELNYHGTGPCAHPSWTFRNSETEYILSGLGCSPDSSPPPDRATGTLEISGGDQTGGHSWCF